MASPKLDACAQGVERTSDAYQGLRTLGSTGRRLLGVASQDLDPVRSRFIAAVTRSPEGIRLQRGRVMDAERNAPRLLEGSPYEVVNLTGVPGNDLDYYVYELGRLQESARAMKKTFDEPADVVTALAEFESAVPKLRAARNPLTHPSDDKRLDDFGWLSALVRFRPNGAVEYLVDPRFEHHDAAERLAEALLAFLRSGLRGER